MRPVAVKSSEQTIWVSCIYNRELYISDHMACLLLAQGRRRRPVESDRSLTAPGCAGSLHTAWNVTEVGVTARVMQGVNMAVAVAQSFKKHPFVFFTHHFSSEYLSHTHVLVSYAISTPWRRLTKVSESREWQCAVWCPFSVNGGQWPVTN
jgi:hypothetical protein